MVRLRSVAVPVGGFFAGMIFSSALNYTLAAGFAKYNIPLWNLVVTGLARFQDGRRERRLANQRRQGNFHLSARRRRAPGSCEPGPVSPGRLP